MDIEKYKREMMKLYSRRKPDEISQQENVNAESVRTDGEIKSQEGTVNRSVVQEQKQEQPLRENVGVDGDIKNQEETFDKYGVREQEKEQPLRENVNAESVRADGDIKSQEETVNKSGVQEQEQSLRENVRTESVQTDGDSKSQEETVNKSGVQEQEQSLQENFGSETVDYSERYPDIDFSELESDLGTLPSEETNNPPEYISEESLGSATGYIIVNARAGDESTAVVGAVVLVTAIVDGNRMILASGVTDENGTTPKFSLPAPEYSLSQRPSPSSRPYNLFDVSVTAKGYFNARSVDVPVFADTVSIQNFSMIPVPFMMKSNDETVTYFNQEPFA